MSNQKGYRITKTIVTWEEESITERILLTTAFFRESGGKQFWVAIVVSYDRSEEFSMFGESFKRVKKALTKEKSSTSSIPGDRKNII